MKRSDILCCTVCLLLVCCMAFELTSCSADTVYAADLTEGIEGRPVADCGDLTNGNILSTDFGLQLLRAYGDEKNPLVSPYSVLCALCMTANGANGKTAEEFAASLGMDAQAWNAYLHTYTARLPQGDGYAVKAANSIWFYDDLIAPSAAFLQTNADYFGADLYAAPFDATTLRDINTWVSKKTDGMIPAILDEIPANVLMYLINAVSFDAEWEKPYEALAVSDGMFITEDGDARRVKMMSGTVDRYLTDEGAVGFLKYYKDRKYAFAALLPDEGVSISDYVASLDGERLAAILSGAERKSVRASIPKFESEFSAELSSALKEMGICDAFDSDAADFSGISAADLYISRVLHKTAIRVDENGTKAGAATAVEMRLMCAPIFESIELDRPFLYMLIDCENNVPIFLGTVTDIGE